MTVTQTLMDIGDWSINLKPGTPGRVLDRLADRYSCIMITTQRLPVDVARDVARPLYRGVFLKRDGAGGSTISGKGVEWYLGTPADKDNSDGLGVGHNTDGFGPFMDAIWSSTDVAVATNAVAAKIGGTGSTVVSGTVTGLVQGTPRTALDNIICHGALPVEWRLRPDLTLEVYDPALITDPVAVVSAGATGAQPGSDYVGWNVANITPTIDATDKRNRWADTYGNDGSHGFVLGALIKSTAAPVDASRTWKGVQLEVCGFGTYNDKDEAGATAEVNRQLALHALITTGLEIDVDGWLPHTQLVDPMAVVGATIAVHLPELGIYDTTADQIAWHGALIRPTNVRCLGIEWPITQGVGVYLDNRHQGGELLDITDSVVMESDGHAGSTATTLHLGAMPRWWNGLRPVTVTH